MAIRYSFALASLIAVSSAGAQESVKVTYTTVAVPVKRALAELSAKTGMKLESTAAVENEILILRLNNASMDEVMKQIATVTSGDWTKREDTYYLGSSIGTRNREAAASNKAFQDKIVKALKAIQDRLAKASKPSTTKGGEEVDEAGMSGFFGSMGGGSDALAKMALAIGANNISAVPPNGRIVFSTSPTQMQNRIPGNVAPYIAEYVEAHNKMVAAQKNDEPAKDETPEGMGAFMKMFKPGKLVPITAPPAKILIAAERGSMMGLTLELKLYDINGKIVGRQSLPLQIDSAFSMADMADMATNPGGTTAPQADNGKPIKLSPISQELSGMGQNIGMMQGGKMKLSDELQARLKDPVTYDPLSFAQSEALIATAGAKDEQLVANLPDGLLSFLSSFRKQGALTTTSFLKDIQKGDAVKVTEANGWMVAMPGDPVDSRGERTNRKSLKRLLDASIANGYLSLDDLASYAQDNAAPMTEAPASTVYIMLFAPGAMQQGMMGTMNWDLVRLYGTLSASQKQSIQSGGQIPFGSLTPPQKAIVTKMVYGPDNDLEIVSAKKKDEDPISAMINKQLTKFMPGNGGDYRTEPTEIMPSGLPANGYIQVQYSSEPVGLPIGMSTNLGQFQTMGPMELGILKLFKEDPKMSAMGGAIPTIESMRVGTRAKYDFQFFVAQDVAQSGGLQDDKVSKNSPVYKMDALPQDFQDSIAKMSAMFKKNPFWQMIGAGMAGREQTPP